jgi:hypothetical protein
MESEAISVSPGLGGRADREARTSFTALFVPGGAKDEAMQELQEVARSAGLLEERSIAATPVVQTMRSPDKCSAPQAAESGNR